MKRILYSCFILLSLCINHSLKAQNSYFEIPNNGQCANASGSYTATAQIGLNVPNATNYLWTVAGANCTPSFVAVAGTSLAPWGNVTNTAITIVIPCCGLYTVTCTAQIGSAASAVNQNTFTSGGFSTGVIFCPTGAQITPSVQTICLGNTATIAAAGATAYAWSNGTSNTTGTLVVSPTVNTVYTYTGTTAQGCTITPTQPATVNVQAITLSVTPTTQSMCAGSPINFAANANAVSNASVAPGTVITGYSWLAPPSPGNQFGTSASASTIAPGNNATYSVIVTYTGPAGTCTALGTSSVIITTSIPLTLTPSSPSVCPNGAITLTAVSTPSVAAPNFTWTTNDGTGNTVSPFHNNPHLITVNSTLPWTVTVVGDYFGCPGTASTTIGLLALTPTLTSSAPLTCPGQSLTLTACGGINYTFTEIPNNTAITSTIGTAAAASGCATIATTPTVSQFPIQYCVDSYSAGCVGSACILVNTKILTPTLTASTPSICPNTEFTLTAGGSGVYAGASYTYASGYNPSIGNSNPQLHTPPTTATLAQSYTVTVDSAGCIGQASITIYSLTLRTLISSPTPSICQGHSLTLNSTGGAGTTYTFYASVPQFSNSATAYSIDAGTSSTTPHQPASTVTTIIYTVRADSVGCKGNSTFTVGILDLGPTLTLTSMPSGSICPGTSNALDIIASGASNYTFYAPGTGSFATGTGAMNSQTVVGSTNSPLVIPLTGLVYTVTADSAGCQGTNTLVLYERILHPQVVLTPTIVCSGVPIVLTASNVAGNSSATYTNVNYTFVALTSPTSTAVILGPSTSYSATDSPTAPVTYSVFVDSSGCKGISPGATITIRPDLPLLPSTSAASVCPGLNATLSVVAPTTALAYTYTWTQVSGTGSMTAPTTASNVNVNPITNSTYSVHVLDSLGCVGNTVVSVGIDPSISFSLSLASSGSTICLTQSVTLSASNTIAPISLGTINYTWTPNGGLTPPTVASSVIANPSVTTIYTVTADNGYGCVAQNTISVAVGIVPGTVTAVNASASSVCVGFTSTLTAFGASSYTWTGSTFTNAIAQQSISVPSGNYTVILSNGGGCSSTAVFNVGFLPNLVPTIISTPASQTTCITSNNPKFSKAVHLTASGAGTYVWFPYNPIYMTYSLGPQTDVRPPASTQYTVIGSTAICSGSAVISINVIPQFSINVVPPLPAMCLGDSLKLSIVNIGSNAVGPVSAFTYSWTEALNAPPLSLSDYFTSTVTVYPQNTTTYTTEVRDSRDCISLPRLVTVTVLPKPLTAIAIPTINSVATNTVCFVGLNPGATDVTINLTGNNMNTGLPFGVVPTYTWISPYSSINSILSPANNNAVTVNAPIRLLNGSAVAVYTLISGYNGVQGCKRFDTVSVRVIDCRPIRNVKFRTAEPNDTICARNCITFMSLTDTMAGGPQNYLWKFEGGAPATSTLANPTVCYNFPNPSRPYSVILQVSNPYPIIDPNGGPGGSALTFGQNLIKVVDIPNVTIVAPGQVQSDTTVRFGQSVELKGSGAHTYEWSPAYNISSLSKPNVTVNPFKTTQYILTGYNSRSCYSSDTINVIIVENCGEMYVPNAFTPNNDGANDVLYVRGICLQSLTFMIFNRWGEKIFETADQSKGWDGSYKGEDLNTGVFVYRLEGKTYDGKGFSTKGNITLIR